MPSIMTEFESSPTQRTRLIQNGGLISNSYEKHKEPRHKQNTNFPKSVYLIVGNEFCERYSFYALRTILALYLASELSLGENTATSVYHGWSSFCYCTPLIGAIIADSYLGRYKTIAYVSVVYIIGNITLALSAVTVLITSIRLQTILSAIGLIVIGLGTGGIKPCVSAFGGDQFQLPQQEHQLTKFFYIFYFAVNAGGAFSSFLTPVFREDVTCFGGDCYPLAFGVPAALMILSLGIFLAGSRLYKIATPEGNVTSEVMSCIHYAASRRLFGKAKSSHWLDLAEDKFSISLVQDIKSLFRVLVLLIPVPVFWTLFDQQSTRWMFQATRMNGYTRMWNIKPDQIQVLNPVMILVLIPIFDMLVYPTFEKFNILTKPLRRIVAGGILTAAAFFVSGIVQTSIEDNAIDFIPAGQIHVELLNTLSCNLNVDVNGSQHHFLPAFDKIVMRLDEADLNLTVMVKENKPHHSNFEPGILFTRRSTGTRSQRISVVVSSWNNALSLLALPQDLMTFASRPDEGTVRIITSSLMTDQHLVITNKRNSYNFHAKFQQKGLTVTDAVNVSPGEYKIFVSNGTSSERMGPVLIGKDVARTILLFKSSIAGSDDLDLRMFPWDGMELSMLWLLPQYVLISIGEMFFVVTGLEFAFKEAPDSMKSVVQAAWLLTVAIGNLIMMVVAELRVFNWQSHEFFLFGVLMLLDMAFFHYLAQRYESSVIYTYNLHPSSFSELNHMSVHQDCLDLEGSSEEELQ